MLFCPMLLTGEQQKVNFLSFVVLDKSVGCYLNKTIDKIEFADVGAATKVVLGFRLGKY